MSWISLSILLLFEVYFIHAQVPGVGKCPAVTVMTSFNATQYWGTWHEIARFYTSFESKEKCIRAQYTPTQSGHFTVHNDAFSEDTGKYITTTGDAFAPDPNVPAKIKVRFSKGSPYSDYWVLDTDYNTYTLIYSCINVFNVRHYEFSWILSREPSLDEAIRQQLYNKLDSFGINSSNFNLTNQKDCPWTIY